jgi:type I restriction enzyme S subunit
MSEYKDFEQTEIGKIPNDWEVVRLGDVIRDIKNGFASGKRDESGIAQIRMNNVTTDGVLILDSYLKVPIPQNANEWVLEEGDFLFNNTNSYDLVGKSTIFRNAPFPCTFSNHFTRIRFREDIVLPEIILYHFLILWRKGYFKSVAIRHVGQSAVHTSHLLKLKIPLPPLPEQKKIAEILSTVDEAIGKTDQAIERTQRLKKGLMQKLFTKGIVDSRQHTGERKFKTTEIGRIPEEWEVVRLGDISSDLIGGGTPSTSNPDYWDGDIAWMTSAHINGREVTTGQRYITKEGLQNSVTNVVSKDNLLVATRVGIGKAAVNKIDIAISQDLTGIIIDKNKSVSDFVYWCLIHNENRLKSIAQGSTIKGILREGLGNLKLPLPPLPEQKRIAEILSTVDQRLELLRKRKEKLQRIKQGLMEDLLTGRVGVDSRQ